MPSETTMAGANMGMGMIGSLLAGMGLYEAGQQEQQAYDYNADIAMLNAGNEMVSVEQKYAQIVGKQATAYAASGVDITRGSPLLMMAVTAGRGGRQQAQIYEAGSSEVALDRYYGKIAAWRGKMQGIQTFLGGMSKSAQGYLDATGYTGSDKGGDPFGGQSSVGYVVPGYET